MAENKQTPNEAANKANIAKARAAAQAKKAAAKAAQAQVEETPVVKEITEEDIVKSQVKAKEEERKKEVAPVVAVVEAKPVERNTRKPILERLPGGKWIVKIGKKILCKGSKEKAEHYANQF